MDKVKECSFLDYHIISLTLKGHELSGYLIKTWKQSLLNTKVGNDIPLTINVCNLPIYQLCNKPLPDKTSPLRCTI